MYHVPTYQNYLQEYLNSNISEAFATDLDVFVESAMIHSWIYGNHHRYITGFKVGDTNMLTNQLRYVKYKENKRFRLNALDEI